MTDDIHDEWGDEPALRPKGMDSKSGDVLFIIVAVLSIFGMMALLILAAFER